MKETAIKGMKNDRLREFENMQLLSDEQELWESQLVLLEREQFPITYTSP